MTNLQTLSAYLQECRWCSFKKSIKNGQVYDIKLDMLPYDNNNKLFILGQAKLLDGSNIQFSMPMAKKIAVQQDQNNLVINGAMYTDATLEPDFWQTFNKLIDDNNGEVKFPNGWTLKRIGIAKTEKIDENLAKQSKPLGVEQSNTTLNIGQGSLAFKLERILDFSDEINPEFEMNSKLMREKSDFMPETYGGFVWENPEGHQASCGIVQEFVKNKGDMWGYSLGYIKGKLMTNYLRQIDLTEKNCPEFIELVKKLERRVADMGECLSRPDDDPKFTPEPVTASFMRTYKKNMTVQLHKTKRSISQHLNELPEPTLSIACELLNNWDELTNNYINKNLEKIIQSEDKGYICRVHGDFHLGQVMVTENDDLRFIDFAGEPALPINQRKQKHIFVRDIAGMYRSITGYLGETAVTEFAAAAPSVEVAQERLNWGRKAIEPLVHKAGQEFLGEHKMSDPWLALEVLRKNIYEVDYEINHRPKESFISTTIKNLSDLLHKDTGGGGAFMGFGNDFDDASGL